MRSSTSVTPAADQAAATARSCAAHELTVPDRTTSPAEKVSTESRSASSTASRRNAQLMASPAEPASGAWAKATALSMPTTPGTLAVRDSAASRWWCHSTVPVRVTKPSRACASTVIGTEPSSISASSTSPRRSSSSRRSLSGICILSSLATRVTPRTRAAALPPARLCRRLAAVPRSVTMPLAADTSIAALSTCGSQHSSAATSRRR